MTDITKKKAVKDVINVKKQQLNKIGYKDLMDWLQSDKNNLYIGRDMSYYVAGSTGSVWQNPFPVAKLNKIYKTGVVRYNLDQSLELYRQHIEQNPDLLNRLGELDGKVLGCWCKPNKCHGDVLAKLVKKYCN
jgi:hypothetical protein